MLFVGFELPVHVHTRNVKTRCMLCRLPHTLSCPTWDSLSFCLCQVRHYTIYAMHTCTHYNLYHAYMSARFQSSRIRRLESGGWPAPPWRCVPSSYRIFAHHLNRYGLLATSIRYRMCYFVSFHFLSSPHCRRSRWRGPSKRTMVCVGICVCLAVLAMSAWGVISRLVQQMCHTHTLVHTSRGTLTHAHTHTRYGRWRLFLPFVSVGRKA